MSASDPQTNQPVEPLDPATQEKIHEFCHELALALRRITGKVVEDDLEGLPVDMGERHPETPEKQSV